MMIKLVKPRRSQKSFLSWVGAPTRTDRSLPAPCASRRLGLPGLKSRRSSPHLSAFSTPTVLCTSGRKPKRSGPKHFQCWLRLHICAILENFSIFSSPVFPQCNLAMDMSLWMKVTRNLEIGWQTYSRNVTIWLQVIYYMKYCKSNSVENLAIFNGYNDDL